MLLVSIAPKVKKGLASERLVSGGLRLLPRATAIAVHPTKQLYSAGQLSCKSVAPLRSCLHQERQAQLRSGHCIPPSPLLSCPRERRIAVKILPYSATHDTDLQCAFLGGFGIWLFQERSDRIPDVRQRLESTCTKCGKHTNDFECIAHDDCGQEFRAEVDSTMRCERLCKTILHRCIVGKFAVI